MITIFIPMHTCTHMYTNNVIAYTVSGVRRILTQWGQSRSTGQGTVAPGRSPRGSGQRPEIFFGQSPTSTFTVAHFANCFSIERERDCSVAVAYAEFQSHFTII